jgi:hypothetical protein
MRPMGRFKTACGSQSVAVDWRLSIVTPCTARARQQGPSVQSIASRPAATSASLARLNGLLPKKPLFAAWGDGCDEQMVVCRDVSMSSHLLRASSPHRMNTTRSIFPLTTLMTSSVNVSQPLPRCDAAAPARTVNAALSSSTPRRAHCSRFPWSGIGVPRSSCSSFWMFLSDGGLGTSHGTEKASPTLCASSDAVDRGR